MTYIITLSMVSWKIERGEVYVPALDMVPHLGLEGFKYNLEKICFNLPLSSKVRCDIDYSLLFVAEFSEQFAQPFKSTSDNKIFFSVHECFDKCRGGTGRDP